MIPIQYQPEWRPVLATLFIQPVFGGDGRAFLGREQVTARSDQQPTATKYRITIFQQKQGVLNRKWGGIRQPEKDADLWTAPVIVYRFEGESVIVSHPHKHRCDEAHAVLASR